jgi:hypothetical protein
MLPYMGLLVHNIAELHPILLTIQLHQPPHTILHPPYNVISFSMTLLCWLKNGRDNLNITPQSNDSAFLLEHFLTLPDIVPPVSLPTTYFSSQPPVHTL